MRVSDPLTGRLGLRAGMPDVSPHVANIGTARPGLGAHPQTRAFLLHAQRLRVPRRNLFQSADYVKVGERASGGVVLAATGGEIDSIDFDGDSRSEKSFPIRIFLRKPSPLPVIEITAFLQRQN